jgi:putative transposase
VLHLYGAEQSGGEDCVRACIDGLQGLAEAMATVWPNTQGPRCLVQKGRHRRPSRLWPARQTVAAALQAIDGAATEAAAAQALERVAARWEATSPPLRPRGLADWEPLTVLCAAPPALRRVFSMPNAMASWNSTLRQRLTTRGVSPNDESMVQGWSLALQRVAKRWRRLRRAWQPHSLGWCCCVALGCRCEKKLHSYFDTQVV